MLNTVISERDNSSSQVFQATRSLNQVRRLRSFREIEGHGIRICAKSTIGHRLSVILALPSLFCRNLN